MGHVKSEAFSRVHLCDIRNEAETAVSRRCESDHSGTRQFGCIVIVDVVKVWMVGKVGGFPNGRRRAFGKCPTVALRDDFVK